MGARAAVANGVRRTNGKENVCPICGAVLADGRASCGECGWFEAAPAAWPIRTGPVARTAAMLKPQFDRLLVLAAVLAFASVYLPWLPGLYGSVPGWKVPYSQPDIPLDEIRHLEMVKRPESLFLINIVGIVAVLFCRTSRHAGLRDLVACVLLVTGGGYILAYFLDEWRWCLFYNYVGPYAAFMSMALMVTAGLLRTKFMTWVPQSRVLLLVASAFLLTGFFLPWSLDQSGAHLMFVAQHFYWMGIPKIYAYLMLVFPLLGFVGFIAAFREIPAKTNIIVRLWPLLLGLAALVYFRAVWATYLIGFPVGSWGTLAGLTVLTAAGILDVSPSRPFLMRLLLWIFAALSALVWLRFVSGELSPLLSGLSNAPGPIVF